MADSNYILIAKTDAWNARTTPAASWWLLNPQGLSMSQPIELKQTLGIRVDQGKAVLSCGIEEIIDLAGTDLRSLRGKAAT
ncbi:MAG TPA: hypothetical protein VIS99_12175 [Terrimicrobiaceae bacterium]